MHSLHLHSTLPIIILFVPPHDSALPAVQMRRRWLEMVVANSLPYQEGLHRRGCAGFYPARIPFIVEQENRLP